MESITAQQLKEIRADWKMSQSAFAQLLGVNPRTYEGYESSRFAVPSTVGKHVQTIQKLRVLYSAWDRFATPLAGTEEFDKAIDDQEKLWDELFPELNRL